MTIPSCLAKTIPALWSDGRVWPRLCGTRTGSCRHQVTVHALCAALVLALACAGSAATPQKKKKTARRPAASRSSRSRPKPSSAANTLESLVRAWRDSPSPARRAAVESWAAAHTRGNTGVLAQLALGIGSYEQKDYARAVAAFGKVGDKLPQLADYTGYYLAASRMELKDPGGVVKHLQAVRAAGVRSPLAGRSWVLEARALKDSNAASAVALLREHYPELPQPDGDLTLADAYQAAEDLAHAVDFYQRVYYRYITGDAATQAAAALLALKDSMGTAYPLPLPEQVLRQGDRLMEFGEYRRAAAEYLSLEGKLTGSARDRAQVRVAAADFRDGKTAAALRYLRRLELAPSDADAERLYYLVECARRLEDDEQMMAAVRQLDEQYPKSLWRLRALISAANRYLLVNRPDDFLPLYQAAYTDFPDQPQAGLCHWKVTFQAYLQAKSNAGDLLREHLHNYPAHATAGAALYFLGRLAEQQHDPGTARACYRRLATTFENHYYAMLARERLANADVANAPIPPAAEHFAAELDLPERQPVSTRSTRETALRIERSRLLRTAGLADLADSELRFGAKTDGQPALLAIEMAGEAEATHLSVRIMKSLSPDYLNLKLDQAPRRFWELLFPLPYRQELVSYARQRNLDPFLVAGLIRQESEFNPGARSPANAYGLTQVRPGTGRTYARKLGMRFSTRVLFQPAANLKIGTSILRSMLDQNDGKLEQTLAAYNAGPNRLAEWRTWASYREPAEFVESIPFTETRDYVQAVLRNADIYRRLYR